jgi:hypothetical protein
VLGVFGVLELGGGVHWIALDGMRHCDSDTVTATLVMGCEYTMGSFRIIWDGHHGLWNIKCTVQ